MRRPLRSTRPFAAAVVALALACLVAAPAIAQAPPPAEGNNRHSAYELATIDEVLRSLGAERDPAPEGKIIERIDVVPLDVIEPRDPLPTWVNVFHATTRRQVIEREMLLRPGEPYAQVVVDDTLRNLRQLPQLSLVLVVTTRGSRPDRVGVVVVTKDVWSLRLNWNLVATPSGIDQLELQPSERNVFGTHQIVSALYILEPSAQTLGLAYTVPRVPGSRVAVVASADVMVNRASGAAEGTYGSLVAGQPIYSGRTPWAWDATVSWVDIVQRKYSNAALSLYADPATHHDLPFEYHTRQFHAAYEVTRSFGWEVKHDLTLTALVDRRVYRTDFPGADPQTVTDFVDQFVPASDTRVGPSIQYHTYAKRYLRAVDFESLALQEDYRLGHDVVLRAQPSFRAIGASRDVVSLYGAAQYSVAVRDGMLRASFFSLMEPEPTRIADAYVNPAVHLVTPTIGGLGRIVADGAILWRLRNFQNLSETLGGGDQLRGYPTNFFVGKDVVTYNVELRSHPVEILSCQLGTALFYDAGDAFDGRGDYAIHQSAGVGLRALFPQLDRVVFRADVGFPFERPIDPSTGRAIAPVGFVVSFGQAFGVPTVSPTPVLPTEATELQE